MIGQEVKLDRDNTWQCRHAEQTGEPVPPTRLGLDQTQELNPSVLISAPRRWTNCPDCGTYWRVWPELGAAKASIELNATAHPSNHRFRRALVLDIDRIIDIVKCQLPAIRVVQNLNVWPADDEGLWFFQLPNVQNNIQLESSTGICPFILEHSGMNTAKDAWRATSIEEAARMVVEYLQSQAPTCNDSPVG